MSTPRAAADVNFHAGGLCVVGPMGIWHGQKVIGPKSGKETDKDSLPSNVSKAGKLRRRKRNFSLQQLVSALARLL